MSTLIVYATKYGCTEKCAKKLSEKLLDNALLCNVKKEKLPDLSGYDTIIIGGSVYIGKVQKEISAFCSKNLEVLMNKRVGLFTCGMQEEAVDAAFSNSFPKELLSSAVAKICFGGEFTFEKMNFLERMIVKKVAKADKDVSSVSEVEIDKFAQSMNNA